MFEYNTVVMEQVAMHYPVTEMLCNSKIRYVPCIVPCKTRLVWRRKEDTFITG